MKRHRTILGKPKSRRGLILVMTAWILAFIAVLSIGLAHAVSVSIKSVQFQRDNLKRLYCAKAGLSKAIAVLASDTTAETDTLNELWATGYDTSTGAEKFIFKDISVGDGVFTVSNHYANAPDTQPIEMFGASDEEQRININKASAKILEAFFSEIGLDAPEDLSKAILYWRGEGEAGEVFYESGDIPYAARRAPFKTFAELSLVKGFRGQDGAIKKCQQWLTVFPDDNLININTAPWIVLKAVFAGLGADQVNEGLSGRLADNVIAYRTGVDRQQATADDVAITQDKIKEAVKNISNLLDTREAGWVDNTIFPFTVKSKLFRIEVASRLKHSKATKKITAVVMRQNSGTTAQRAKLRYWHEE